MLRVGGGENHNNSGGGDGDNSPGSDGSCGGWEEVVVGVVTIMTQYWW